MKLAKGNFGSRGNVWTVAKNTVEKGLQYAYAHRQLKKRTFRSLWITRINAAVRAYGMTYSEFIGKVNAKGIAINRKVMADLAMNEPKAFEAIVIAGRRHPKALPPDVGIVRSGCSPVRPEQPNRDIERGFGRLADTPLNLFRPKSERSDKVCRMFPDRRQAYRHNR